jgi:phosphatidylglycerol lysyltransferase
MRARSMVLAHGWNSTSFQIVNPGIKRWFPASGDGVVGYVPANKTRIVVGSPVCEGSRIAAIAAEFESEAQLAGEHVCYFGAEERLGSIYANSLGHTHFLIGAQPSWDVTHWAQIVAGNRSLRAQLNRAKNKGVTVTEWPAERATGDPELEQCLHSWLDSKGLPPLHFMIEPETLKRLDGRRIFVAERAGRSEGFVVLSPIVNRNGWLFEQFPHRPGAPNGTVELMIDTAMRALAADGFEYVTLGLAPLSTRSGDQITNVPLWLRILLGWMRKHAKRFYNFEGLDTFKAKLKPDKWEPVFAVSNEPQVSFRTIYAITSVFSGGSPFGLFARTVSKAAATELRWLKHRVLR